MPPAVYLRFFYYRLAAVVRGGLTKRRVLTIKNRPILGTILTIGIAVITTFTTVPTLAIDVTSTAPTHTVAQAHTHNYGHSVEKVVRAYFKDIPIMAEVAWCESRFVHTDPHTGTVKRGHMNPADLGVMQINEYYHGVRAHALNLDLTKLEDNLAYARYLYEKEGTRPWNASQFCWEHTLLAMR